MTDHELFIDWQRRKSPDAFARLVAAHIDFVYSVAERRVRDSHLAEDITQEVFIVLYRKGARIDAQVPLAGWLFNTTRLLSVQNLRTASRRTRHESEAIMSQDSKASGDPLWPLIAGEIDQAVADLPSTDRDAILLRYFKHQSSAEIAVTLAISEEAAKRRVQRGLDTLQKLLASRGFATATSVAIAVSLSAHALQAAPPALASSISASVASTAVKTLATKGILMAVKLKSVLITATVLVALTTVTVAVVELAKPAIPAAASMSVDASVPVAATDAASQLQPTAAAAEPWKGWGAGTYPGVSPFAAVRWNGDAPEVQVNATWYQLLAINGIAAEQIVAAAKTADREWQRRFEEDLPALLAFMGHEPGDTVTLQVKNLATQKDETLADVAMTMDNRRAIMQARHPGQPSPNPQPAP